MVSKSLVLGFHGCDHSTATRIVTAGSNFLTRQKNYHWLGQGIYFWEDSPSRAWRWASDAHKRGDIEKPAVIGAVIDLGRCLNLVDPSALRMVKEAHTKYVALCKKAGQEPKKNGGPEFRARYLDCEVFDTLHLLRELAREPPFDTVRAFFTEGTPLYEGAGLRDQDHIQICVRDSSKIIGCFFPRGEDAKRLA